MHVCPECGEAFGGPGFCPRDGVELKDAAGDQLLGQTVGSYRIARLLGEGGMGRVYKGAHPGIGSRVAVKVLAVECAQNRELVDRFFAEARAVNLIRHESIVNVLDLSTLPDGRPYIVMEYLDGAPLSAVIEQRGPLPLGGFARVMGEVLDALAAAHAKGIVHRDLKPDNIFVSPAGRAKVLDFGIAKLMPQLGGQAGPTRTGSLLGTPQYMSPEQALAQSVDARTDVYACGVILFEGVTGRPPFSGASLFELLQQHIQAPPPRPAMMRPDLPPAYENVILRALEKDPGRRFQTAVELAGALNEASQSLPPHAWAAIGTASGSRPQVSPPSGSGWALGQTPHGAPTPHPAGPTFPPPGTGPGLVAIPASPSLYQSAQPAGGRKKAGLYVGGLLALVVVGGGIVFMATRAGNTDGDKRIALAEKGTEAVNDPEPTEDPSQAAVPADITGAPIGPKGDPAKHALDEAKRQLQRLNKDGKLGDLEKDLEKMAADLEGDTADTGDDGDGDGDGSAAAGGFDARHFDVQTFIGAAEELAREHYEDAVLVRIDADGVFPDGHADLTLDDGFSVLYRFQSPSRSKPEKNAIVGVKSKNQNCIFYVSVDKGGVNPYPVDGWDCEYPLIGRPKCSIKEVWSKAIQQGAPAKNAVAELGYWDDGHGKGRWHVSVGEDFSKWVLDGCK